MLASPSILIVDDEEQNRALLRAILGGDHRILEAADGPGALRILAVERVDLVLLDVMMPGMTGYDVCTKVKERRGEPFLPVLLVTALADQEQKNLGLQAGADDFLTKPVDRRELLLRVRAFLRLRAQDALIRLQLRQLASLQQTKDEMVSLMVHDMRSPLAGIVAHLHLALEEVPEGPAREDLESALKGADSVLASLEEALQIRLMEEGHLPISRSRVDLQALVGEAAATLEPGARLKHIALSTAVEGDPSAFLDGKLVRRAVENLLSNALKYGLGRPIEVSVRAEASRAVLVVRDHGIGIAQDEQAKILGPFAHAVAVEHHEGLGLGLWIAREILNASGGRIKVDSRPEQGSTFTVELPL